jgi:hypothetical protein
MLCAAYLILNRLMETLYNTILFLDILILTTVGSEVQLSDIMYIFISRAEFFVARMWYLSIRPLSRDQWMLPL